MERTDGTASRQSPQPQDEPGQPPGCARTPARRRRPQSKLGDNTPQRGVIAAVPEAFTAWRMSNARIESAASAFTALSPLVRNLPPPDIRVIVSKGCSTVHRRIVIRVGSAWMRASMRSSGFDRRADGSCAGRQACISASRRGCRMRASDTGLLACGCGRQTGATSAPQGADGVGRLVIDELRRSEVVRLHRAALDGSRHFDVLALAHERWARPRGRLARSGKRVERASTVRDQRRSAATLGIYP